ncbi:MAG: P-loop NTPase fold protein [Bacilli bacterium]
MNRNELKITSENIEKTLKNDVLNRKKTLLQLVKLLNSLDENFVISIDGNWGVGKTFFIKQLLYLYEIENYSNFIEGKNLKYIEDFKSKYIPIYYNAWENDNHADVIESFIYNILDAFPKYKKDLKVKKQDFEEIIKPFLKNLVEKTTLGFISKEAIDNIKCFEDLVKGVITTEEQKESLYEIFNILTKNDIRILLIVDELDRCKPDYAIKVLETIKHFFNYERITTLVVTNNNQLSECIKHVYGYNFNGYEYLNKMYDTVLSLNTENIENYITEYLRFPNTGYLSEEISYSIIKYLNFSLRECNSFASMYKISLKYINLTHGFDQEAYIIQSNIFLPLGLALKVKNISEYNKYIKGQSDSFLKNFLKYLQNEKKGEKYTSWLLRIFKIDNQDQLEEKVIEFYHDAFKVNKYSFDKYPMIEALTLMGNFVEYKRENDEEK